MQRFMALLLIIPLGSGPAVQSQTSESFQFRLYCDEYGQAVHAEYLSSAGVDFLLNHGRAKQNEFIPTDQITEQPHLKSVNVPYGFTLSNATIKSLAQLKSLKELQLGFAGVDSEYVTIEEGLAPLGELKELERLHICKERMVDQDLQFITQLPKLKHLVFNADTGSKEDDPCCTDQCADYLAQAPQLETLWIHDAGNLTDKFVKKISAHLIQLEALDLGSSELTDDSLKQISEHCKKLKKLRLSSDQFTEKGVLYLRELKDLRELWLSGSNIIRQKKE